MTALVFGLKTKILARSVEIGFRLYFFKCKNEFVKYLYVGGGEKERQFQCHDWR